MPQRGADGPHESGGHRYGYRAAEAAGVPQGWVNRDWSPEQKEHRARQAAEDDRQRKASAEIRELIRKFPALKVTAARFFDNKHIATRILADPVFQNRVEEQRRRQKVFDANRPAR